MITEINRPNPFVTVWAESKKSKKISVYETASEAEAEHKARASMELGFPEITMRSAMRGGQPPWGEDHNGILNRITESLQWIQAGGCASFNEELRDKIGGYPKGAILQPKSTTITLTVNDDPLFLWFSTIDENTNNPDETISPDNGWVKLDFKDLEKRLKAAEDHIIVIDGRLDRHDTDISGINGRLDRHDTDISDIYNDKLPAKAQKEGSCRQDFSADSMTAKQYGFCSTDISQNTIFKEIQGEVQLYTDICYRVYVKNNKEPILSVERDSWTFGGTTGYLRADWIDCYGSFHVYDLLAFSSEDKLKTWNQRYDKSSSDLVFEYFENDIKTFEAIRVSAKTGDINASWGAFTNEHGADLAEYYQADRGDYEPGTLMCHGVDTEVTLCQSIDQSDDFFGVVSTSPAYVMNGKGKDESNSVLMALNGKVPVKVKGIVKCGDKITIGQDGYGVVSTNKNDVIVGRAKENKATEDVGLVSCYVQAYM